MYLDDVPYKKVALGPGEILGSPEINGNILFLMNRYIHVCIIYACGMNCTQSLTVLITHGQACDTSCKHYTYTHIIYTEYNSFHMHK